MSSRGALATKDLVNIHFWLRCGTEILPPFGRLDDNY